MAKKKSPATKQNPTTPINIIKEETCKQLTYQIGLNVDQDIYLKISSNTGGGFFSNEWIAFNDIQATFKALPEDMPITSMALRPLFRGKSVNTPGFMISVLTAEKLLEPMPKRKRVHQACDPASFLASLNQGGRVANSKKPAGKAKAKAKAKPAAKAKTAPKRSAKTAKTPRKSPARSKKA